jgi:cytochrome c oxidase subunit II
MSDHKLAHKMEQVFLGLAGAMLIVFLIALFYSAFGMGLHLPDRVGEIDPTEVRTTPPFDDPGVHEVGPGEYEVVILGSAWSFQPSEVRVPAGATVTFVATAADVLHGLHVEGTRVNFMLIPGQIARVTYTFREPGEHLIICHEYCGAGHHLMYGRVIVEEGEGEA